MEKKFCSHCGAYLKTAKKIIIEKEEISPEEEKQAINPSDVDVSSVGDVPMMNIYKNSCINQAYNVC